MKIIKFLKKLKKSFSNYDPLIKILISRGNLIGNLNEYRRNYPKIHFAPVLKSNAYGHGLIEVAKILDNEEKPFFVVDSLFEARTLRENGIKTEILIIGYTRPSDIAGNKLSDVVFAIIGQSQLEEVSQISNQAVKIHLKIDTGMHRQGILQDQISGAIRIIKSHKNIILEGICSHFADAGNSDGLFTNKQIMEWNKIVKIFKENFDSLKYFHLSATTGTKYSGEIQANVVRLGIGLYGTTETTGLKLRPVLEMQTIISSVKTMHKGESIGYNLTYRAEDELKVANVPVGYFEGVNRGLSNRGFFKIGNHFCPIIGKVSMNITSTNATSVPAAKEGDEIIIISSNQSDKNSVINIAKIAGTIPYEILVHIPQHLKRIVVN
jgi:alanine racemase